MKVVKKILPVVLAAAAIYFTAGAALGIAGTAGGWGGAVSGLVGKFGLGSTLSSVLTGAVTQAGYGALIGGGLAAVTGGDVSKGLLRGALAGAVTGGITGALTAPATAASSGATGTGTIPSTATSLNAPIIPVTRAPLGPLAASGSTETTGLLSGLGDFAKTPGGGAIIGGAVQGIGAGIGNFALAEADIEAANIEAAQKEAERARIAANFGVGGGGGLLTGTTVDTTARPTPTQQFNPNTVLAKARGAMWRYNPATGQLELTPTA